MDLYKKYRPKTLGELVGNQELVESLQGKITEGFPSALLLAGPSGTGKTTVARALQAELNCADAYFRVIDAVNDGGIDTIRDLRETLAYTPFGDDVVRVFFIDECHRLSAQASDNLLTCLENTPPRVYFILATTEPEKLTKTLQNRCMRVETRPLDQLTVARDILNPVCKAENKVVDKKILMRIGKDCQGSSRMALTMLQSIIDLPADKMDAALNNCVSEELDSREFYKALMARDAKACFSVLGRLGGDPERIRRGVLGYFSAIYRNSLKPEAYFIMKSFEKDYFATGQAGLTLSVAEACNRD